LPDSLAHKIDESPAGKSHKTSKVRRVLVWVGVAGVLNTCALVLQPFGVRKLENDSLAVTSEPPSAVATTAPVIAAAVASVPARAAMRSELRLPASDEAALPLPGSKAARAERPTSDPRDESPGATPPKRELRDDARRAAKNEQSPARSGSKAEALGQAPQGNVSSNQPQSEPPAGSAQQSAPSQQAASAPESQSQGAPTTTDPCRACEQADVDCAPRLAALESRADKLPLAQPLMACARRSKCATWSGGYTLIDCWCGDTDFDACITGQQPPTGECRAELEAAAESGDPVTVTDRVTNPQYATGLVDEVLGCDSAKCEAVCRL
jgi:hypothetical protein